MGATRLSTQAFTPLVGDGTNAFLQKINLTSPVLLSDGEKFLVAVLIRDVIALPPNDVYPFVVDTSGVSAGTFWDRSTPNTFNLDDLSGAIPIDQSFVPGGYIAGPGHIVIRAEASVVPELATDALFAFAAAALLASKWGER